MSIEENKALVRRYTDAFIKRDLAALDEILTTDQARDSKKTIAWAFDTYGDDYRAEITDMVAEGDKVWVRLAVSGGHTGVLRGIAPTGKKWTGIGVGFCRIAHGRIAEIETLWDTLEQLLHLGATIAPPKS